MENKVFLFEFEIEFEIRRSTTKLARTRSPFNLLCILSRSLVRIKVHMHIIITVY